MSYLMSTEELAALLTVVGWDRVEIKIEKDHYRVIIKG
jgi:hypothetical protein